MGGDALRWSALWRAAGPPLPAGLTTAGAWLTRSSAAGRGRPRSWCWTPSASTWGRPWPRGSITRKACRAQRPPGARAAALHHRPGHGDGAAHRRGGVARPIWTTSSLAFVGGRAVSVNLSVAENVAPGGRHVPNSQIVTMDRTAGGEFPALASLQTPRGPRRHHRQAWGTTTSWPFKAAAGCQSLSVRRGASPQPGLAADSGRHRPRLHPLAGTKRRM